MQLHVKLFAAVKDVIGQDEIILELPAPSTIENVRDAILKGHSEVSELLCHSKFAVNCEFATDLTEVHEQDEIACIPPVSGG